MALTDAMVALYSTTLAAATSSVTIAGIPTTGYRDLRLVVSIKHTTGSRYTIMRINGDAGTNYPEIQMYANGSTASSGAGTGAAVALLNNFYESSTEFTIGTIDIFDYSQTNKHKSILVRSNLASSAVNVMAARWASTAAINSLTFIATDGGSNDFAIGSTFELFGIKA